MRDPLAEPTVSVLMAAYNVEAYLDQAVRSILSQKGVSVEVVVVDDGSTDGTAEILRDLATKDDRVRPHFLQENLGVCRARNVALAAARGTWLAVVDADDWIVPERFARLLKVAEETGADAVADDQVFVAGSDATPIRRLFVREAAGATPMRAAHFFDRDIPETPGYGHLKPLMRRQFLQSREICYRPGAERSEDFLLTAECLAAGARFVLLNEPLYFYRLHPNSVVARIPADAALAVIDRINQRALDLFSRTGDSDALDALERRQQRIAQAMRYRRIVNPLKSGDFVCAARHLGQDWGYVPRLITRLIGAAMGRLTTTSAVERRSRRAR